MTGKKAELLAVLLSCCLAVGVSGCGVSASVAALREKEDSPFAGGVIYPEGGYIAMAETPYSEEEVARAAEELVRAGVLTAEESGALPMDEAISRAWFIRLVCGAAGYELSAEDEIPGEQWYAPYVRAGYAGGIFGADGTQLTFTPTDGFFMGRRGYPEMEKPMIRSDARYILEHTITGQKALPAEQTGGLSDEGYLSVGHALICAQEVLNGQRAEPTTLVEPPTAAEAILKNRRIIHAGGEISPDGLNIYTYSNSAEALVNAYRNGNRVIEIDLTQTSDGHLACIHGWSPKRSKFITKDVPLSLAEWMDLRIYELFTPLCLESLAGFMREHPDLYVVTDVKDENRQAAEMIAQTCPDLLERFIIQIYTDEEYDRIRELGFSNIIYTFYDLAKAKKLDTEHWVRYAQKHALLGYTYPMEYFDTPGYHEEMLKTGVMLFVHTVNEPDKIQECYDAGVAAVYTDRSQ